MKALVTGANGQLGQELLHTAPPANEVLALGHAELDITRADDVERAVSEFGPSVVINCAAFTAVDQAESDSGRDQAFAINAEAVKHLATSTAAAEARLLHVSTDFVFDGSGNRPYRSTDAVNPVSVYGQSKLEGERHVLDGSANALVVRSSWIYSRFGSNFVKTMLRLMGERDEIGVVSDQVGSPTWARGLAEALWCAAGDRDLGGVVHYSDVGSASWYDFALAIRDLSLSQGLLEREIPIRALTTDEYPTPARRPAFSVLERDAIWGSFELAAVPWRDQLRAMLSDLSEERT